MLLVRALAVLLLCTLAIGGCASREAMGTGAVTMLGPGVVNNPKNRSLRFDLLRYGLDSFCDAMRAGGTPLKLNDEEPVMGRFHADACNSQAIDEPSRKSFVVQFSGTGYATGRQGGRIGFSARGLVEYATDFLLHEDALYVYFRPRVVDATAFQTLLVESQLAKTALDLFGVDPDAFGQSVVEGQLRRGFTVIRYSSAGDTEFGMGTIPAGQRPYQPFSVKTEDKRMLVNERTEVHPGQQDFIGPLSVESDSQALYLTVDVDGTSAVDLLLIPEAEGRTLWDQYVQKPGPVSPTSPPILVEAVARGVSYQRQVPLPKGRYYLMLDHSAAAGITVPAQGDSGSARVDVLVLLGDRP